MKVLLTGASGFIGRHALAALRAQGIETVVLGRRSPPEVAAQDFIEADLLASPDFAALMRQARATHLLHLAWYAEHGRYWTSPLNLRWVDASVRLVEAFCAAGGRHVVAAGTCAEYDWAQGYCREDAGALAPASLYGVAKDATRRLLTEVCKSRQVGLTWGRIFFPYGPGEPAQKLVPSLIEVFRGRRAPFAVNVGAYRDFLHVSDVAQAFVTLLRAEAMGPCNIGSGEPVRLGELIGQLAQLCGADAQPVLALAATREGEPPMLVAQAGRLRALGWAPRLTLAQGLRQSLAD